MVNDSLNKAKLDPVGTACLCTGWGRVVKETGAPEVRSCSRRCAGSCSSRVSTPLESRTGALKNVQLGVNFALLF